MSGSPGENGATKGGRNRGWSNVFTSQERYPGPGFRLPPAPERVVTLVTVIFHDALDAVDIGHGHLVADPLTTFLEAGLCMTSSFVLDCVQTYVDCFQSSFQEGVPR